MMLFIFIAQLSFAYVFGKPNMHSKVEFMAAEIRGEDYVRPKPSAIHDISTFDVTSASSSCSVEQVHISVGDEEGSIVVSYTSPAFNLPSIVYVAEYAELLSDVIPSSPSVTVVYGDKPYFYSSLIYIVPNLINPAMGAPAETVNDIVKMENTSAWAFDPATNTKYSNNKFISVASVKTITAATTTLSGLQSYNNPYAIYDSPMIYTVKITGLMSRTVYYYKPYGSCTVYSFRNPYSYCPKDAAGSPVRPNPFPMTIALTADLGQTDVSAASINAMRAMNPEFAVLVGDLSYADGYPLRWDSFGRFMSPVFSMIPLLTTGGNHEVNLIAGEFFHDSILRFVNISFISHRMVWVKIGNITSPAGPPLIRGLALHPLLTGRVPLVESFSFL